MSYILVVEDEPSIATSLEFLMQREGHTVEVCAGVDAALAALRERRPALILIDVMLPSERDGFDLCQLIRERPEWQDIRIVMVTARGREADVEKGQALGADRYITKPFAIQDVVTEVRALLGT